MTAERDKAIAEAVIEAAADRAESFIGCDDVARVIRSLDLGAIIASVPGPAQVMRKIIQISTTDVENTISTQCNWLTTAVCDDGTAWVIHGNDSKWYQLPPLPLPLAPTEGKP
jgi:hypothetical protein